MNYVVIVLLIIGVVLLAVGYRKNHRNLLLVGAIVLFVSAAIQPFVQGFTQGAHDGLSSQSADSPK